MWRETGRRVGFLGVDAWALLPLIVFLVYWSKSTLYFSIAGVVLFAAMERFGLSPAAALRRARRFITGKVRSAVQAHKRRYFA